MFYNIKSNRDYLKLKKSLLENPRSILVRNICDSAKICFIQTFDTSTKLIVVPDERTAMFFYEDFKFYDKNVYYFYEKDLLFENSNVDEDKIIRARTNIILKLLNNEKITVITTISSVLEKMTTIENLKNSIVKLEKGIEFGFDTFIKKLIEIGYVRVSEIETIGEFAVHGGIIDIYPINYENPIRIDFFDNIIDVIKFFNIETKRTIEEIDKVQIVPINDSKKFDKCFLLDYFPSDTIVFLDEPKRLIEKIDLMVDMVHESIENRNKENEENYELDNIDADNELKIIDFFDKKYVLDKLTSGFNIQLTSIDDTPYINSEKISNAKNAWDYDFDFMMIPPTFDKLDYENTKIELKKYLDNGFVGLVVLNSHIRAERLKNELLNEHINATLIENIDEEINIGTLGIYVGELTSGFIDEMDKFFILTERDLFGIEPERKHRIKKSKNREGYVAINDLSELNIGDYVIHDIHGIGIFKGLARLKIDDIEKDYVKVEYADGGILYVLATKLDKLERYASKNATNLRLNKLGSNDFIKLRNKVKEDVFEIAKDLIDLYAKRYDTRGYSFSKDTLWQREFEETFPYIETSDQLLAIENVKNDMESEKAMDRLICGDVGFGKTEVALRAAFKAVQDGKQVCYLVPTTVLCMQHFKTFKNRFAKYPINIEFLSRFNKKSKNDKIIDELKNGKVDVVIGTHRLLSDDVSFKNLGLLIIDEEQRFGVSHKEKIKKLKNNVDALTLTATPIPRTLYMSLSGIRNMSLLTEAPPERMPIKTYVLAYSDELIREAISRELKRDGQVFIVHNKVSDIYNFAEKILKLCPYAKIAVAHGKLNENELSDVMLSFIDKKYNVLVTTTIIETGIDIQNANTLIIDNAEKFGLSQLYQLRGRVGRSNRTAYAFFMYDKSKHLTEDEFERLKAIKENTKLGSGLKIAMRDLEMRGAGNVLGLSQSGHMEAVGYDMYMKLLNDAIKYIKEEKNENDISDLDDKNNDFINDFDTIVDIDIDAYIPASYIEDESTKLNMYRKLSKCVTEDEFNDLVLEFNDRYGAIPHELENLLYIAKLKVKSHKYYVTKLDIKKTIVSIEFTKKHKLNVDSVLDIVNSFCGTLRVINGENVKLSYRAKAEDKPNIEKSLKIANFIIDNLKLQNDI